MVRKLRVVADGEGPAATAKRAPRKRAQRTVGQAAASGDRRALLVALRRRIAKAIDDPNTSARDLAALIRQRLRSVQRSRRSTSPEPAGRVAAGEIRYLPIPTTKPGTSRQYES